MKIDSNAIKNRLISQYEENSRVIAKGVNNSINTARIEALKNFKHLGIPNRKNESYKYTHVEPYFDNHFEPVFETDDLMIDLEEIFKCDIPELDTITLLTLNGFYYKNNSISGLPENVIVSSLFEGSLKNASLFQTHYAHYADTSKDGLVAMNTLFAQDGLFLYIPDNVIIEKPIQIINIANSFKPLRINQRNLIVVGKNAQVKIVVCDHTLCNRGFLTNSVTEIAVAENAQVEYYKVQNENIQSRQISNTYINQKANSNFVSNTLTLHGGLIRNNIYIQLDEPGAEANALGFFFADQEQHVANYVDVMHKEPHCLSNQLYKGILNDIATGAFNGKIYVNKDAQKTLAYQKNNNLLLSDTAKMYSKPQLEIYADDVTCSHGATVGQLDEEAMFYLRSRGIPLHEAKHLLMYAFAHDIISKINVEPLKNRIIDLTEKRLRGELSRCSYCQVRCG